MEGAGGPGRQGKREIRNARQGARGTAVGRGENLLAKGREMLSGSTTIAILGGTGKEGRGLALRWANAGHRVVIGTRDPQKGAAVAADLNLRLGRDTIESNTNLFAARAAEIVVLTVPFTAQVATALEVRTALEGKLLIDVTVPLVAPNVGRVQLPNGESAVEALQSILGKEVCVVSAFQNVSAHHLLDLGHQLDCDVLVCGNQADAVADVISLARDAGMNAYAAGPLANSAVAEGLTSVLISINRLYKVSAAGIRITGLVTQTLQTSAADAG